MRGERAVLARRCDRRRLLAGLGLTPLLAACSGGAPAATFDLSALPAGPRSGALRGQLIVAEPVAGLALDSERILVRPTPQSVAWLTGAQWSDRLPRLLQSRLVQSFENSRLLRQVGRPGDKIAADFLLDSEIRAFEIDVSEGRARVEITVKLVREGSGRIAAAEVFSASAPGGARDGAEASAALDAALGEALGKIVAWTAARV